MTLLHSMLQVLNSYLRSLGFFVFLYFYESAYGVGTKKNELLLTLWLNKWIYHLWLATLCMSKFNLLKCVLLQITINVFMRVFADSLHNPRSSSQVGGIWIWRHGADSESDVLRMHHDESWLCWSVWTARQPQGVTSILHSPLCFTTL